MIFDFQKKSKSIYNLLELIDTDINIFIEDELIPNFKAKIQSQ